MQNSPLHAQPVPSGFAPSAAGTASRRDRPLWVLAFACAVVLVFLLVRNMGLYPTVFGDEYLYSRHSRLLALSESILPNYIYLGLYRVTNVCGDGFLECAKALNAVFFVAAAPFVYLTARRVAGEWASVVVAVLAIVGPISSFTAYFMPESFYFLGFWVFAWVLTGLSSGSSVRQWVLCGAVLGLVALIKPHGLLLMPGLLLYVAYVHPGAPLRGRQWMAAAAALIGTALVTKLALGYLLAGRPGLSLFGSMYATVTDQCKISADAALGCLTRAAPHFARSLWGNTLATLFMFGLPLAVAGAVALGGLSRGAAQQPARRSAQQQIAFLALAVIASLVCATAAFSSLLAEWDLLHQRYYDFAFPLLYIVCAGCLQGSALPERPKLRYVTAFALCALVAFLAFTNFAPYRPSYVGGPEIRGLHASSAVFLAACGVFAAVAILWAVRRNAGIRAYLYGVLPLFVLVTAVQVNTDVRFRMVADPYDKAGMFMKQYLSERQMDKLVVASSNVGDAWRVLWHLDAASVPLQLIPPGSEYDRATVPPGKEWVLLLEDHQAKGGSHFQLDASVFRLVPATDALEVDFTSANMSPLIETAHGLAQNESWGVWTLADVVRFVFTGPLPEKFTLTLVAAPFGPNLGREFKVQAGGAESSFVLPSTSQTKVELVVSNPDRSRELRIRIPAPTTPQSLGMGGDIRKLGMGLSKMTIKPL